MKYLRGFFFGVLVEQNSNLNSIKLQSVNNKVVQVAENVQRMNVKTRAEVSGSCGDHI